MACIRDVNCGFCCEMRAHHTFCYWAGPTQLGYCLFLLQPEPLTESSAVQAGHVVHIGHVQLGHPERLAVQLGPWKISCIALTVRAFSATAACGTFGSNFCVFVYSADNEWNWCSPKSPSVSRRSSARSFLSRESRAKLLPAIAHLSAKQI